MIPESISNLNERETPGRAMSSAGTDRFCDASQFDPFQEGLDEHSTAERLHTHHGAYSGLGYSGTDPRQGDCESRVTRQRVRQI